MAQQRSCRRSLWVTRWRCILFGWSFFICSLAVPGLAQEIVLKAWTIGPDDPSVYRATNLHTAAERLNAELVQAGARERVKVDSECWTGQEHEYIGRYATAGYIRPLDDLQAVYQAALADLYPVLWQAVHFRGQIWGLPQDTEARMMYVRTDHLRQLGWSAESIADLPPRVEQGDFTLFDLIELAQQVKEAGIAPWGLYHHPTGGVDVLQIYLAFGGQLVDETGV